MKRMIKDRKYREFFILSRKYSKNRYREIDLRLNGGVFKVPDAASFFAMWKEIVINECYEFENITDDNPVIVDFGANIGVSVYYFAMKYRTAQIYAYEADPKIYKYLVHNVKQFDNGNIHLYNKAVSDKNGKVRFYSEGSDAGRFAKEDESAIEVETLCANDVLKSFNKVDMLKIDIEGAERFVLPSLYNQLNKVNNIFIEYHSEKDKEQCLTEIVNLLNDFRLYIRPGYCPSKPLKEITDYMGYDMELNLYGIRKDKR